MDVVMLCCIETMHLSHLNCYYNVFSWCTTKNLQLIRFLSLHHIYSPLLYKLGGQTIL